MLLYVVAWLDINCNIASKCYNNELSQIADRLVRTVHQYIISSHLEQLVIDQLCMQKLSTLCMRRNNVVLRNEMKNILKLLNISSEELKNWRIEDIQIIVLVFIAKWQHDNMTMTRWQNDKMTTWQNDKFRSDKMTEAKSDKIF